MSLAPDLFDLKTLETEPGGGINLSPPCSNRGPLIPNQHGTFDDYLAFHSFCGLCPSG